MNGPNRRLNRPEFAWPGTEARLTSGFVAFLISSALVGGLLGLFEMRSNNAATARAVAQNRKASGVLAEREQRPPADATNARRRPSLPPA